jgi:hypothetical protein
LFKKEDRKKKMGRPVRGWFKFFSLRVFEVLERAQGFAVLVQNLPFQIVEDQITDCLGSEKNLYFLVEISGQGTRGHRTMGRDVWRIYNLCLLD